MMLVVVVLVDCRKHQHKPPISFHQRLHRTVSTHSSTSTPPPQLSHTCDAIVSSQQPLLALQLAARAHYKPIVGLTSQILLDSIFGMHV